jgi:hypothetical protein
VSVAAQTENLSEMRAKAAALLQKDNVTDALPLLEKSRSRPGRRRNAVLSRFRAARQAMNSKDKVERKQLRLRARGSFIKAKAMGKTDNIVDALSALFRRTAANRKVFSENEQANSLMEAARKRSLREKSTMRSPHTRGFAARPENLRSCAFSGDMYLKKTISRTPKFGIKSDCD